jgi:hypothetical protein
MKKHYRMNQPPTFTMGTLNVSFQLSVLLQWHLMFGWTLVTGSD